MALELYILTSSRDVEFCFHSPMHRSCGGDEMSTHVRHLDERCKSDCLSHAALTLLILEYFFLDVLLAQVEAKQI